MVPSPRIEREPPALQAGVQADYTNSANVLVAAEGLNPRPAGYEPDELSLLHAATQLVAEGGIEPPT